MNFLSHYYFYRSDDPYYNTGLVLPDLVKNFCKAHLRPGNNFVNPAFSALSEGSLMHLEADRKFHNSSFFHETLALTSGLLDASCGWPRKWFLNHLLCEILIDRVLIDRHETLCADFYRQLENTDANKIALFLKLSGVLNYQNFAPGLERFVSIRFIFEYLHNEKIVLALNRVYQRLGIAYNWTQEDQTLLLSQIPEILNYIDTNLSKLEFELK